MDYPQVHCLAQAQSIVIYTLSSSAFHHFLLLLRSAAAMPLSVTAAVLRPSISALSLSSSHSSFLHLPKPSIPVTAAATEALTFRSTTIRAMKSLQGRVVCDVNEKTISVEVTRLAPHPKYKRRVKKKKKYQAHDPDNVFKVGDFVQLEKCRPISKTKTFLAVPVRPKTKAAKPKEEDSEGGLGIPLESATQR